MNSFLRICSVVIVFISLHINAFAQAPVANFTVSNDSGCAPMVVTFISTSTGSPTGYEWNFGDGNTSMNAGTAAHTYSTPGTYTVKLKVTNASGSNTKTITGAVTVLPAPTVNFTGSPLSGCPPLIVSFTDNSNPNFPGAATYDWSFGTGIPSQTQNPTHTFNTTGDYHVTLKVTNAAGCWNDLLKQQYIHVYAVPVADFNFTPICTAPGTTTFTSTVTGGSGPYTYSWNYGDGSSLGSGSTSSHSYAVSNVYNVTLIVTDVNGCQDTVIKPVSVGALNAAFTAPTGVSCVGNPVHFLNTSTAATYSTWNFGDGNTSSTMSPIHTYSSPGTFRVKLQVSDASSTCIDTVSTVITISNGPTPVFSIAPSIPCPASDTLFFSNQTTGAVSYLWDFGDGSTSTAASPYHIYNFDSVYTIVLKATDMYGCSNRMFKTDTFFKTDLKIQTVPALYEHCVPATIQFKDSLIHQYYTSATFLPNYPLPGWRYHPETPTTPPLPIFVVSATWTFGDGPSISTALTPAHTYVNPGKYLVTHSATTNTGCTFIDTMTISVGNKPHASFSFLDDTLCVDDIVKLINQSTGADEYFWYIYDTYNSWIPSGYTTPASPDYTSSISNPGIFTITLVAKSNGCADTFTHTKKLVVHPPKAIPVLVIDCDTPTLVRFYDSSVGPVSSRIWNFGDGFTDTSKNPVHQYSSLGPYTATLTVTNDSTGCSHTEPYSLLLYVPTADFVANDTAICKGDSISLTPTFSASVKAYDFLPLAPDPKDGLYHFPSPGIYSVHLNFTDDNGCLHDTVKTNYILVAAPNPNPQAMPVIGCSPLNVLFIENGSNTPGAYTTTWDWTFGDNTRDTVTNDSVYHLYPPGTFTVKVIVTDNVGCVDSVIRNAYISSHHTIASFVADDTTRCIGDTVHFTNNSSSATSSNLTYTWDFGDSSPTVSTKNPFHIYTQTGTYTVKLIVTDNIGCADTLIKTNYIQLTKPNAAFTMDDTFALCPPLIVQFMNGSSGATTYRWMFGDGSTTGVPSPSNIYSNPGMYNIVMIAKDINGCTDTAYGSAEVLGYAGAVTYTPLKGCNPLTVNFTANLTNVNNFLWDFSDGTIIPATGNTISHTYTFPGKFLPKIVFTDSAGCVNSSSGLDTIYVDDVIADFSSSPLCINTPITLKDSSYSYFSAVTGWSWDINNGQAVSTQKTASASFSSTGSYPVVLIVKNANGCMDTLYDNITILPLPTIRAGADTVICVGDAATLSAFGGVSYTWAPPATLGCPTCGTTSASPTSPTNYIVTGTDINGCANKDTVKVDLQTKTTSEVGPGGEICADSSFQLNASGAQRYEWRPAESLNDPTISNPVASPNVTTTYIVLAYEGSCPADSHTVRVVVHPLPTVRASGTETIVVGNSVNLNAAGTNISVYTWKPSGSLSCADCSSPIARPTATTTYIIEVASDFGCKAWDSVTIKVLCDQSQLFIPNTFSPNGDGNNDVFYPRGIGLQSIRSFRIYNRWGELVYERESIQLNDAASAWDGTFKGNALTPDVYVYVVEGVCDGGETMIWKGDVTLIR